MKPWKKIFVRLFVKFRFKFTATTSADIEDSQASKMVAVWWYDESAEDQRAPHKVSEDEREDRERQRQRQRGEVGQGQGQGLS